MIRFIHTADIHYGMENYGRIDTRSGIHTRLLDFDRAFNFCIDFAIQENVDFFLIAGDAYKTPNPSPTQQRLFLKALLRLHAAHIPVVIVIGNHDNPLSFGKANTLDILNDLPLETFHVISKPTSLILNTKNGPVQIVGIPWPTRNTLALSDNQQFKTVEQLNEYITKRVTNIIQVYAQQLDHSIPAVLTAHLTVSSGIFSGSEKRAVYGHDPIFLPSELAIPPFDYIALGHLHRYQQLNLNMHPSIVYSGSIERIDFGERKEEKGFCFVTIHCKQQTTHEFIKVPTRPFIQIELKLQHTEEVTYTQQLLAEIEKYDLTHAIVKIMYHVPTLIKDNVNTSTIQKACNAAHDLIGIFPVHEPRPRAHRTNMRIEMNLETILDLYFSQKKEKKDKKQKLVEYILQLREEINQEQDH